MVTRLGVARRGVRATPSTRAVWSRVSVAARDGVAGAVQPVGGGPRAGAARRATPTLRPRRDAVPLRGPGRCPASAGPRAGGGPGPHAAGGPGHPQCARSWQGVRRTRAHRPPGPTDRIGDGPRGLPDHRLATQSVRGASRRGPAGGPVPRRVAGRAGGPIVRAPARDAVRAHPSAGDPAVAGAGGGVRQRADSRDPGGARADVRHHPTDGQRGAAGPGTPGCGPAQPRPDHGARRSRTAAPVGPRARGLSPGPPGLTPAYAGTRPRPRRWGGSGWPRVR